MKIIIIKEDNEININWQPKAGTWEIIDILQETIKKLDGGFIERENKKYEDNKNKENK